MPIGIALFQKQDSAHALQCVELVLHLFLEQSNAVIAPVDLEFVAANVDALLAHNEFGIRPDSRQSWSGIARLELQKPYLVMRTAESASTQVQFRRDVI